MYAEITVRCKADLPANLDKSLQSRFNNKTDTSTAIDHTYLKDNKSIAALVIYAQLSSSRVVLVFKPESRTLKLHIENALKKNSLRALKREIEGAIKDIEDFLKLYKNKFKKVQIVITGDDEIMYGELIPWRAKVKRLLLEDIVIKFIIPFLTYLASVIFNQEPEKAMINAVVAFLSLLTYAVAKSFNAPRVEYKEV